MTRAGAAARPDAIRRHNLSLLLTQIHRDGVITRAELTQRLGLSRSTIGALVADLTELGLVTESVPTGGARAGRPSYLVGPRSDGPFAVAVDVDITHITTAAVAIGGEVLHRHVIETGPEPSPPLAVAQHVVDAVGVLQDAVGADTWPVGIGVSMPGTVNRHTGTVVFAPNLLWRHEPFGAMLAQMAPGSIPIAIGNDADLAVLAEHLRGAGRDCDDVIYLVGRVGVGAGIVVNGAPLRGHDGHAGEVGHNVFDPAGPACHCGKHGCIETYIGENALFELAGRRFPPTVDDVAALFADAHAGDERAAAAVRTVAEALGRAVADMVNVLNPERVILGGSLAEVFHFAGEDVAESVRRNAMATAPEMVQLCTPGLGEDSSLLGAAELAFTQLLADPAHLTISVSAG
jgi:predicted NBD/HSP70 family sugar kinase